LKGGAANSSRSSPPNLPDALIGGDEGSLAVGGPRAAGAAGRLIGYLVSPGHIAELTFFAGAEAAAAAFGAAAFPPALYLISARPNASFTFAICSSGTFSIYGLKVRSPRIFINVPRHSAADDRTGSALSPNSVTRTSASGLI
jgi:hypothetical protein